MSRRSPSRGGTASAGTDRLDDVPRFLAMRRQDIPHSEECNHGKRSGRPAPAAASRALRAIGPEGKRAPGRLFSQAFEFSNEDAKPAALSCSQAWEGTARKPERGQARLAVLLPSL